jgi:hypothetical protein
MMVSLLEAGALFKELRELLGPEFSAFVAAQMGPTPDEADVLIRFREGAGIDKNVMHGEVDLPWLFELLTLVANACAEKPAASLRAGSGTSTSERPERIVKVHGAQLASPHAADTPPPQGVAGTDGAKEDLDEAFDWIDGFLNVDEAPNRGDSK